MKTRVIQALLRLASTTYQEVYMLHGSKDEYVVAEDLVEDVASLCRQAQQPTFVADFDAQQVSAMSAMITSIKLHGPRLFLSSTTITADRLVFEDQDWAAMRQVASECLSKFGVNATDIDANEIDRLR